MSTPPFFLTVTIFLAAPLAAFAQAVSAAAQPKVDAQIKEIAVWAADATLVAAVRAHNASLPSEQAALDQDKWRALTVLDPLVRSFTKNPVGQFLKARKTDLISEAFVSDAAGFKVGFLAKTTNWCHAGKPKHDAPMTGKTWQGSVEVDESTGQQQVQISVPVLDGGKPIGSLVVGLNLASLTR